MSADSTRRITMHGQAGHTRRLRAKRPCGIAIRGLRQPATRSATPANELSRQVDLLETRITARIRRLENRVKNNVNAAAQRTETGIIAKLEEKDLLALQRFEATRMGWSRFILSQCLRSFASLCIRNAPLILSMVLSIEVASGVAAGPIGLAVSAGAIAAVVLVVLSWEAYKAVKAYRALRAPREAEPRPVQLPWYRRFTDFIKFAFFRAIS